MFESIFKVFSLVMDSLYDGWSVSLGPSNVVVLVQVMQILSYQPGRGPDLLGVSVS